MLFNIPIIAVTALSAAAQHLIIVVGICLHLASLKAGGFKRF